MIKLTNVSLYRGTKLLLEHVDLTIQQGQRVGVIGANGTGKSSFFQLLSGELSADSGEIYIPRSIRIACMAQEVVAEQRSAVDYVLDGDTELRATENRIQRAIEQDDHAALTSAYAHLEVIDGHTARNRAEQLLHGLGFAVAEFQQAVCEFSGGWRIRLNLAQALMCPSQLLLLDEPTNHLDLDAILWLEQWLCSYQGTLLLISHDRDFLDAVVTRIVHIEQQKLYAYTGNYSAYEIQRAERLAQQQAQYQKQQRIKADIQRFVDRFRAKATKARQAQSRMKALARMQDIAPAHSDSPFDFHFVEPGKASDPLLVLDRADLGYRQPILSQVNLSIRAGSRIGLLGVNGAGKSTLVKSLAGQLPLLAGACIKGDNLQIGYFAQDQLQALDMQASPLLHLARLSPGAREQELRNFLGGFHFHGDMAIGPIKHFSGGEKARLALAIVVWQRPNLLILDEPTNHLDLEMRHALTVALQEYSGALIMVSHDRHLLRNTVDELILVANGRVTAFDGDLLDYQQMQSSAMRTSASSSANSNLANSNSEVVDKKTQRQLAAARRQQLAPLTRQIQKIESALALNQAELSNISQRLHDPEYYKEEKKAELQALLIQQGALEKANRELEEQWFNNTEELDQLQELAIESTRIGKQVI